jgi:hypothetical protein
MKKILIVAIGLFVLASCQEKQRYTQQSPEIDNFKKVIEAYKNLDWESHITFYTDTAKICTNETKEKAKTVLQAMEQYKEDAALFSWIVENEEYEMVVTDKGETWVNFWGLWKGTNRLTNKEYEIPFHNTARFVDGKIVEEHGYWNNSEIVTDMLKQAETSEPEKVQATE